MGTVYGIEPVLLIDCEELVLFDDAVEGQQLVMAIHVLECIGLALGWYDEVIKHNILLLVLACTEVR